MRKKLILSIMLVLLITLSGWTQSSQKWIVYKDSIKGDTIISYQFTKPELANLRAYVTKLEDYKLLYDVDEQIIDAQNSAVENYKKIITNKDGIIENKNNIISQTNLINDRLTKDVAKFKKRSEKWPYFLGTGFIGGIVLCLLTK